jgi:hypothetical protein
MFMVARVSGGQQVLQRRRLAGIAQRQLRVDVVEQHR